MLASKEVSLNWDSAEWIGGRKDRDKLIAALLMWNISKCNLSYWFVFKFGGECDAERFHPIRGGLWNKTRSLFHLPAACKVCNCFSLHKVLLSWLLARSFYYLRLIGTWSSVSFTLPAFRSKPAVFPLCMQVLAGWADHAHAAGWGFHEGWGGSSVLAALPQREPAGEQADVHLWHPGEILLPPALCVWQILHQGGGNHPSCKSCHTGKEVFDGFDVAVLSPMTAV